MINSLFSNNKKEDKDIQKGLLARQIKVMALMQGEVMAHWAKELGVTRQAVYHVVEGRRKTSRIRNFIEKRLGQKIWYDDI